MTGDYFMILQNNYFTIFHASWHIQINGLDSFCIVIWICLFNYTNVAGTTKKT